MSAFIPNRRDPEVTARAFEKVAADKKREAGDGFDGTWVAHPDLIPTAMAEFDAVLGDRPNQVDRQRDDVRGEGVRSARRAHRPARDRRRACTPTCRSRSATSRRGCGASAPSRSTTSWRMPRPPRSALAGVAVDPPGPLAPQDGDRDHPRVHRGPHRRRCSSEVDASRGRPLRRRRGDLPRGRAGPGVPRVPHAAGVREVPRRDRLRRSHPGSREPTDTRSDPQTQPRKRHDPVPGRHRSHPRAQEAATVPAWDAIDPESVARMRAQNRFRTGLEIAQYTADIMRRDMVEYDADSSVYTQSLGVWHGFIGQQKLISIKKHLKTTNKRYLYLSGWMVAATPLGVRPPSRPVDAREDRGAGPHRGAVHVPPSGGRSRARPALHEARRTPARPATRRRSSSSSRRSTTTRPTSCRSSPTSMRASATPRRPTCSRRR